MKYNLESARLLVDKCPKLSGSQVTSLSSLAGDAGTRQYCRLHLQGPGPESVVLMILSQGAGPYGGGKHNLNQDDTFVEVGQTFRSQGIRVPDLYYDGRKESIPCFLIEDVGDLALWHFAKGELGSKGLEIARQFGDDYVTLLYKRAIDVVKQIQSIPRNQNSVIFQRTISFEKYRKEISEFAEYYAIPRGLTAKQADLLNKFFDVVCESLLAHPKVPSHVDYMSYNLCVLDHGEICVIDFQDCSTVSPVRDVVSLLNDRDIDSALGRERNLELLQYAQLTLAQDADFLKYYDEYLLHWDFRVSGRFMLLSEHRNMPQYGEWVPGTVRRLGRTFQRVVGKYPHVEELISILSALSPDFKSGVEDPWLPDWK